MRENGVEVCEEKVCIHHLWEGEEEQTWAEDSSREQLWVITRDSEMQDFREQRETMAWNQQQRPNKTSTLPNIGIQGRGRDRAFTCESCRGCSIF